MNTAKLHIIANCLLKDLKRCDILNALQRITNALGKLVRHPQDPGLHKELSNSLSQLYQNLEESPVDRFSPTYREAVNEMKTSGKFGISLKESIENIIARNHITHQVALDEISELYNQVKQTYIMLEGLVNGLKYFCFGEDTLNENECEVGIIVPRKYVENNLKAFGKELVEIEKMLLVFSELATGAREPLKVRTISSSELSVFLDYSAEIGACIAIAVERIVALYKKLLEIKKLKSELIKQEVPDKHLNGIDEYIDSNFSPRIGEISDELLKKFGKHIDKERKNEVSIELHNSLCKLSNRIDRGFNIELRVSPIENNSDHNEEPTELDIAVSQILESSKNIEYCNSSCEPVLFLPENNKINKPKK